MITSRRRWHRRLISAISIGLPLLAAAALLQRPDRPIAGSSADPLFQSMGYQISSPPGLHSLIQETRRVNATNIDLELSRNPANQLWLRITPQRELPVSDPLVLWVQGNQQPKDLSKAKLIGSLAGSGSRGWWLPETMRRGSVLLVSGNDAHTLIQLPLKNTKLEGAET